MVAKKDVRSDDKGKVRVRFMDSTRLMEFELDGSNDTLLEGIRQITAAVPASRVQVVRSQPKSLPGAAVSDETEVEDERTEAGEDEVVVTADSPLASRVDEAPKRKSYAPTPPEIVRDLDVEAALSLYDFLAKTAVTKESSGGDMAIAIATWLKEHRNGREIDGPLLYTCTKVLKWGLPTDYTSPLRNMKKAERLASGAVRGAYRLTVVGEGHFRDKLEKP